MPEQATILEIGCGAGGNLGMLKGFGRVSAMETDDRAIVRLGRLEILEHDLFIALVAQGRGR